MEFDHHAWGPSQLARRINCPGSVKLESKCPDLRESEWAKDGHKAHDYAFEVVTHQRRLEDVPYPFQEPVRKYYVHCMKITNGAEHWGAEEQISLDHWIPGCFGTSDHYSVGKGILDVTDYKHGEGVPVSPVENVQMGAYASGLYEQLSPLFGIERIRFHIVQPRTMGAAVQSWEVPDFQFLEELGERVVSAFAESQKKAPDLNPGEWCQFCSARAKCYARFHSVEKALQEHKGGWYEPISTDVQESVQLAFEDTKAAVNHAAGELFMAGLKGGLRRMKLVNRQGRARFNREAYDALVKKHGALVTNEVLRSISEVREQLEFLYGEDSEEARELEQYIERPEGSLVLVPASDARPAHNSATKYFGKVTTDE